MDVDVVFPADHLVYAGSFGRKVKHRKFLECVYGILKVVSQVLYDKEKLWGRNKGYFSKMNQRFLTGVLESLSSEYSILRDKAKKSKTLELNKC